MNAKRESKWGSQPTGNYTWVRFPWGIHEVLTWVRFPWGHRPWVRFSWGACLS